MHTQNYQLVRNNYESLSNAPSTAFWCEAISKGLQSRQNCAEKAMDSLTLVTEYGALLNTAHAFYFHLQNGRNCGGGTVRLSATDPEAPDASAA
jgi:hypothetical protein